jgi:hypothetical protein
MVHANVRRLVLQALDSQTPECGICLENFTHADATVMECCHVACKGCFAQLRKKECPFCRHKFTAPKRTPRETNREINLLRRDIAMLNNEVTFLESENNQLQFRLREARAARQRPVYTPVSPPYSPRRPGDFSPTPRFSPDPPPAEWENRVTTPEAPQPPDAHGRPRPLRVARLRTHPTDPSPGIGGSLWRHHGQRERLGLGRGGPRGGPAG